MSLNIIISKILPLCSFIVLLLVVILLCIHIFLIKCKFSYKLFLSSGSYHRSGTIHISNGIILRNSFSHTYPENFHIEFIDYHYRVNQSAKASDDKFDIFSERDKSHILCPSCNTLIRVPVKFSDILKISCNKCKASIFLFSCNICYDPNILPTDLSDVDSIDFYCGTCNFPLDINSSSPFIKHLCDTKRASKTTSSRNTVKIIRTSKALPKSHSSFDNNSSQASSSKRTINEPKATKLPRISNVDSVEIKHFAYERHISHLIHFTPLSNINSILANGLLSRSCLNNKTAQFSDSNRYDGLIDWISVSISFPNYQMFYSKRQSTNFKWAVLLISPEVLWECKCQFFSTNAASSSNKSRNTFGFVSFKQLFYDAINRKMLPSYYPTDPQAEIMVYKRIDPKYILEICVQNNSDLSASSLNFSIRPEYFSYRVDYEYWKKS